MQVPVFQVLKTWRKFPGQQHPEETVIASFLTRKMATAFAALLVADPTVTGVRIDNGTADVPKELVEAE